MLFPLLGSEEQLQLPCTGFEKKRKTSMYFFVLWCSFHCRASEEQLKLPFTSFQNRREFGLYNFCPKVLFSLKDKGLGSLNCVLEGEGDD